LYNAKNELFSFSFLFLSFWGASWNGWSNILHRSIIPCNGMTNNFSLPADAVVIVSIIILIALFSIQSFGTSKVGFTFAPALALWFFCLASVGIYNLFAHGFTVLRALNPFYIYLFFSKNGKLAWAALGGCVLCITGILALLPILLYLRLWFHICLYGVKFHSFTLRYKTRNVCLLSMQSIAVPDFKCFIVPA